MSNKYQKGEKLICPQCGEGNNLSTEYCWHCYFDFVPNMPKGEKMINQMTSTSFSIEGHRITKTLGVVRGIRVMSRSLPGQFLAALQTIFGGNITLLTELCEEARGQAFDEMLKHASMIGANAVTGIRYDSSSMGQAAEVLCYGTAVITEKV